MSEWEGYEEHMEAERQQAHEESARECHWCEQWFYSDSEGCDSGENGFSHPVCGTCVAEQKAKGELL